MKRLLLVFASCLVGLTTASATNADTKNPHIRNERNRTMRYAEPINFMERGVEFLIFPDGSFDFNTNNYNTAYNDNTYYGRNSRRGRIDVSYRGPHVSVDYSTNRYPRTNGKVRRIGNIYLNYDRYGRITRAGSVFIDYNHGNGWLRQVGGLRVSYNHWGEIVSLRGQVNRYNQNCDVCGMINCNHDHGDRYERHRDHDYDYGDHDRHDDDHYYYFKQNGKVKKHKRR